MSIIIKRILIIFGVCMFLILFFAIQFDVFSWVFYPTKSSPHELSIVCYSGYYDKLVVSLKQYVDGLHICDYTLEIKDGVNVKEPQSYELPKIDNGRVEVNVEFWDDRNEACDNITLVYDDAETFCQNGLLIYFTYSNPPYIPYVYFVSGKETTCYNKTTDSDEFTIETVFPSLLRVIPEKEDPPACYYIYYSGWKENKWVVEEINN